MKTNSFLHTQSLLAVLAAILSVAAGALIMSTIAHGAEISNSVISETPNSSSSLSLKKGEVEVAPFTGISARLGMEVVFTPGAPSGIAKVIAPDEIRQYIKVYVEDEVLQIGIEDVYSTLSNDRWGIQVRVTGDYLESIQVGTAGSVIINNPLIQNSPLKISASTGGAVNFREFSGQEVEIDASTGADVYFLSLEADQVTVKAGMGADVKLRGLSTETIIAHSTTGAEITLSGRCNKKDTGSSLGAEIRERGLIIENTPIRRSALTIPPRNL